MADPRPAQDDLERPARILVVDDDVANLIAVRAVLSELGHPVVTAQSGEEALRHILRNDFAVILLDVRMPNMDGYEAAELIRGRERSRHVPIIFLSGVDKDEMHLFRGYAAGAVDYVFKPVQPLILRSKVAVFTELHQNAERVRRQGEYEKRLLAENLEVRAREAQTSKALEQSLRQQSLVLEALPLALFVSPADGGFRERRFVGGSTERLFGGGDYEENWLERVHPEDRERLEAALQSVALTERYEIEYRIQSADGSSRWVFERTGLEISGSGRELLGVLTDVSERKRLEEQLTHAQKLEAVGQLSGGIAHDFNNMLSVIIGSLSRLGATEEMTAKGQQRLSLALQAAQSCADLTKRLLGFARRQSLDPRELDIAVELDRLQGLFGRVLGEKITAVTKCAEDTPPAYLDRSQFEAAIVNLVVNARDAMPSGGTLTVAAEPVLLEGEEAAIVGVEPGSFIHLAVRDTGIGMDEETRSRALEPFFTTKAPDRGTGLGLSSIYGFISQSGGGIRIESAPGQGTAIHLYVPPVKDTAARRAARAAQPATPRDLTGTGVLLVEDNANVRQVTASMLESMACRVIQADGPDEALRLFRVGGVDLLFTDCMMPGDIDGPALAALLRKENPSLAVLFTSGHREGSGALMSDDALFLPKPFTEQQLAEAMSSLLGARPKHLLGS